MYTHYCPCLPITHLPGCSIWFLCFKNQQAIKVNNEREHVFSYTFSIRLTSLVANSVRFYIEVKHRTLYASFLFFPITLVSWGYLIKTMGFCSWNFDSDKSSTFHLKIIQTHQKLTLTLCNESNPVCLMHLRIHWK